jgi:hypothetical protein
MSYLILSFRRLLFLLVLICTLSVSQSQVFVHEEPRHHPVFQNNEIRILNVLIPPGDISQYHIHHTPSLFIFFTSTATGSQLQGRAALTGQSTAGQILFENLAPPNIRTHRVWNADKDTFHVMDLELLYKDSGFVQNPLTFPGLQSEIDTAWIRVYRLTLLKGKDFMLRNKKHSFILVSLSASVIQTKQTGKTQHQTLKPGSIFDIKRRQSFSLQNISDNTIQFVLLELPDQ